MLKSHFLHTTCHNPDSFDLLINLRELLNTIQAYTKARIADTEVSMFLNISTVEPS
jgi:hypothetical protein